MRREIAGKKTEGLAVRLPEVAEVCGSRPSPRREKILSQSKPTDAKDAIPKHDSTHHCHPRLEEKAPSLATTIEPSHYDGSTFPLWWSNQTATMDPHSHYGGQA
ncbi:hypothetical protein GW17_00051309 [Ensete ventricosum]|nr:hypothetical protein GW17_00051309 [Ensete ventricosum]